MIRSISLHRAQLIPLRSALALRARATSICPAVPSRHHGIELPHPHHQLVRRASTASPKPGPPNEGQPKPKFVTVASTMPFLAVWYLTSPMAVWIQIRTPNHLRLRRHLADRYLAALPDDAELVITTMGALGKPRISHVRMCDLQPARKRLGLVNYVRDSASVDRENARRRWWMFRAVKGFRIEDETTTGRKTKYAWGGVARQLRQRARLERQ
ncbi:hypothetical protein VSDG_06894 [Cytospora chrysosperma]|uniref:Uncharacterized protein n=1 Tax=Cytospora chrysosperma TaxID=252740 RepID=A0A423VQJ9_CYTCH|nr:hypothetical protein VSDG_06894 [Valsa sordida]